MENIVLPDFGNGTLELGIAAGFDSITDIGAFLHFAGAIADDDVAITFALSRLTIPAAWSNITKSFYLRAATFAMRYQLVSADCKIVLNSFRLQQNDAVALNGMLAHDLAGNKVTTLLFATKITWWMMNHHVGKNFNALQGYIGKVARAWNLAEETGMREALLRAAHWIDTKMALVELGIPIAGFQYARRNLSEDMELRLRSNPAGTEKLHTYHEIFKLARRSWYGLYVDMGDINNAIIAIKELVAANPCAYHKDAQYLTGHVRLVNDGFTDEEQSQLSVFIHVVSPQSTLARAGCIKRIEDVRALDAFFKMTALKLQVTRGLNLDAITRLANNKGVGAGGLAVASGFMKLKFLKDPS